MGLDDRCLYRAGGLCGRGRRNFGYRVGYEGRLGDVTPCGVAEGGASDQHHGDRQARQ